MGKVEERLKKAKERYERLKSSKNKGFITKDEQLILEEGTLIHGTGFDETVLKSIAQKGLVGANFTGVTNPDSNEKFPNGVNFFRVPVKCFMKEYFEFYSNTKIDSLGKEKPIKSMKEVQKTDGTPSRGLRFRKEYDFLPRRWSNNRGTWKKDLAFIVNPSSEIQALRNDDPYQKGESELFDKYKGYDDDFKNMKNRVGNILYGIPTSQISGILISPDFEQEIQQIEFLKKTFPDVYITTTEGRVIYKGLEKEEKNNELMEESDIIDQSIQAYSRIEKLPKNNNGLEKKNGKLYLQEGTLLHGTPFDETVLKSIAQKGLVAPEFIENAKKSNNESEKVVMFFRVPNSQTMSEYTEFCSERLSLEQYKQVIEHESFSFYYPMHRAECDFIPNGKFNKNNIAFIINPSKEVGELFQYDAFKEKDTRLLGGAAISKFSKVPERIATTVYGVPQNMISGILVSTEISNDIEKINKLKELFPDKFITTPEGELIYESQKEISNDEEIRRNVFNPFNVISSSNMQRNIKLGNSGEMHRYVAADGSKYLVKPAYKKGTKQQETFRAAVQKAAYEVQRMIDPSSAVVCNVKKINIDGQEIFGTVQEEIQGTNFDDITGVPSEKFQKYGSQFLREFVTDYLLCNYDSHSGNFIVDNNGLLRGIDKEQSFKFIMEESNEKIDLNYAPNGLLHQPIYNKLFKMYEKGKIDLNLEEIFTYLDRIDKIPDDVYMSRFKLYASSKANNPEEEKEILERILSRKQNARNNIKEFLINIKIQRKAKELGITPKEVREKLLKKRESPLPIASETKDSARKIASSETARKVQETHGEIRSDYLELENSTQTKENSVSLDE